MTAITRPYNWSALDDITAARLSQDYSASLLGQDPPAAFVGRVSTAQSIGNNSFTDLNHDTEFGDNDGMYASLATVTIQHDGWYGIWHGVKWASNATGVRSNAISLNGSDVSELGWELPAFAGNPRHSGGGGLVLVSTNTIKLNVFQNSGGALNCNARLTVVRISGPGS